MLSIVKTRVPLSGHYLQWEVNDMEENRQENNTWSWDSATGNSGG